MDNIRAALVLLSFIFLIASATDCDKSKLGYEFTACINDMRKGNDLSFGSCDNYRNSDFLLEVVYMHESFAAYYREGSMRYRLLSR